MEKIPTLNRKLILMGMMGSGKTTMARILAAELGIQHLDLDAYIESSTGQTIPELFDQRGETHFREVEHQALREILCTENTLILALGGGTPCFERNTQCITPQDLTVYLKYSPIQLAQHLENGMDHRPLLSLSDRPLQSVLSELLAIRAPWYEQANIILDGQSGLPIDHELFQIAQNFFFTSTGHTSP